MKDKTGTAPAPPRFSSTSKLEPLSSFDLVCDADYGNFHLSNFNLANKSAVDSVIESAKFDRVNWSGVKLDKCKLSDVRFEGCDFSNSVWTDSKLTRLEYVDCKAIGLRLVDTQIANVLVERVVGKLVQFCGSEFKNVLFRSCSFPGADFSNCSFEDVQFVDCDLREAIFYNAKLEGTNFCGSQMLGFKAHAADLNGMIINQEQALELSQQFARLLRIQVWK